MINYILQRWDFILLGIVFVSTVVWLTRNILEEPILSQEDLNEIQKEQDEEVNMHSTRP